MSTSSNTASEHGFSAGELSAQAKKGWGEGYTLPYSRTDATWATTSARSAAIVALESGGAGIVGPYPPASVAPRSASNSRSTER